jgi:spore germination protein KB
MNGNYNYNKILFITAGGKMKKEVISERQGIILIILYLIGSTLIVGLGGEAKQDSWVAVIIALAFGSMMVLVYARILSHFPGKDLFDILQITMGRTTGKLISVLMIWYAFHLGALVLRNISEFTSTLVFPDTPVVVPMIFFSFLLVWGVKAGLEVMGRWSEFFVWVILILFFIMTGLSITQMDIERIKPIFGAGAKQILISAFSIFSFPFGETVVFTMVFSNITNVKNYTKTFMIGLLGGGLVVLIAALRSTLVLGTYFASRLYFSSYIAISLIHIGQFLQRIEIGVVIIFLICAFVKISMCLLAVCKGISKVFNFDEYKFLATPITVLMLCFSFIVYKSTMEMSEWAFKVYPFYAFSFEIIIPLTVLVVIEIKNKFPSVSNNEQQG